MLYEDRRRAGSFGEDAEQYDRTRPTYPPELVTELLREEPRTVVDVGCGTGIASRLFVDRGCQVTGVEPDPRMAELARRRGIEVEVAVFETWDSGPRRFDLLISAQAWHWVHPERGLAKANDVLRPGGRMAVFWNLAVPPDDVKNALDAVYSQLAPGLDAYSVLLGRGDDKRFEAAQRSMGASGSFTDVAMMTFTHDTTYTTESWLDQLPTHSDHRTLPAERLGPLLDAVGRTVDELGGQFVMHYRTVVVSGYRPTS